MAGSDEQRGSGGAGGSAGGAVAGSLSALLADLARLPPADPGAAWDSWLKPRAVIGRFELVREIGRGGFGVVYEAKDRDLKRSVAFKAVRVGKRAALREERLLREAEAAARLSHPNIVTLHDVGRSEHGPYLVLELLRGETLEQRLGQGRLSVREAFRIAVEVAKGLAHAHAEGVVHRDLTPGNVFLCGDGQVKVLDLGMAHAFGRRKVDGGTPAYMAPEQWRGAPEDERTDVFALGAILYRMLSGEMPFPEDGGKAVQSGRPAPALEVPEVPGVAELVARMLEKDPVRRPRDASEVLAGLSTFQHELERVPMSGAVRVARRRRAYWRAGAFAAAVVLLVTLVLLARRELGSGTAQGRAPSIAVLPFADMSPNHDQEYFADGVAEEILNALAQAQGLRVIGRTSSFSFRGKNEDLRTIGQRLDVGALLEGSVRKDGNRVRVTAKLVRAADGSHLWSQFFDRDQVGVFAVQEEIAREVVEALEVKLLPGQTAAATGRRTSNPEAHRLYLEGRYHFYKYDEGGLKKGVKYLEEAVRLDPSYALAWAALANAYSVLGADLVVPPQEVMSKARSAALRAVSLDPGLAEGHLSLGIVRLFFDWDWRGSGQELARARDLDTNNADVRHFYGHYLEVMGRTDEAVAETRRGLEVDPLSQVMMAELAWALYLAGQDDAAIAQCQRSFELERDSVFTSWAIAPIYAHKGMYPEAIAELARARNLAPDWPVLNIELAYAHALAGEAEQARRLLAELEREPRPYVDAALVAPVHLALGGPDRAMTLLEKAYREHAVSLIFAKVEPKFGPLRADPRFVSLLKKMNLPAD